MRFTEHELTVAVTTAAKIVAGGKIGKRGKGEEKWESMSKIDRYHLLEATLGETGVGRLRQKVTVAARLALVRTALAQLPVRQDPDALIVPDSLEDL